MKNLLLLAALALTTACASNPPLQAAKRAAVRPATAAEPPELVAEAELADAELTTWQQISVDKAAHLEGAQPGELGMSLTQQQAAPAPEAAAPRPAARPKLVSKRSRARLFVLPSRSGN